MKLPTFPNDFPFATCKAGGHRNSINQDEAEILHEYARAINAILRGRTVGTIVHDIEEQDKLGRTDRARLTLESGRAMRAVRAFHDRKRRSKEKDKCLPCFFDTAAYAKEMRA